MSSRPKNSTVSSVISRQLEPKKKYHRLHASPDLGRDRVIYRGPELGPCTEARSAHTGRQDRSFHDVWDTRSPRRMVSGPVGPEVRLGQAHRTWTLTRLALRVT